MSTSGDHGSSSAAPEATASAAQADPTAPEGGAVRACERCGAVCGVDQEWCLSCGVRLTEMSQRLPGLRAAATAVVLGVLLAGGAAAASYAALRGDARKTANTPTPPSGAPVAQAPPSVTDPGTTSSTALPSVTTPTTPSTEDTSKVDTTDTGGDDGDTDSGGGGTTTNTTTTTQTNANGGNTTTNEQPSTPSRVTFARGQGSLYDPDGVVADRGEESQAIDDNRTKAWSVTLAEGQGGGFGYVLDFDQATALKSLRIYTPTDGLVVKVLGTTKTSLPPDALDLGWDTLAGETTLKGASGGKRLTLREVGGRNRKYKHVLVWFTDVPGTPAAARINEIYAYR